MTIRNIEEIISIAKLSLADDNSDLANFPNYGNLYAIYRSIAALLIEQDTKLESTSKDLFLTTATGDALNNKAAEFSVIRQSGSPAIGSVLVSGPRTVIPTGTVLTDPATRIQVRTSERLTTLGSSRLAVSVRSIDEGIIANLPAGTPLRSTLFPNHQFIVGSTYNSFTSKYEGGLAGGAPGESDVQLKSRIRDTINSLGQSTVLAFQTRSLGIAGVDRVFVSDGDPVAGFVTVYVDNRSQSVQRHLKAALRNIKPIGVSVRVKSFDVITVDVSGVIRITSSANIEGIHPQIQASVREYFNNLSPGESVTQQGIAGAVYSSPEITNVEITEPVSSFELSANQLLSLGEINFDYII